MNADRSETNVRDSYRGVVLVLLVTAALGTMVALVGGVLLANSAILAVAITLGLASGALVGVLNAQHVRTNRRKSKQKQRRRQTRPKSAPPACRV